VGGPLVRVFPGLAIEGLSGLIKKISLPTTSFWKW